MEGLPYDVFSLICDALLPTYEAPLLMDMLFPHFYMLCRASTQLCTWICRYLSPHVRRRAVIAFLLRIPLTPLADLNWHGFGKTASDDCYVKVVMLAYCRQKNIVCLFPALTVERTMRKLLIASKVEDDIKCIYNSNEKTTQTSI